jgi:hypothetical protein
MEPDGSLPYSEEPSTGPYPQPDESSLHHPILFLLRPILTSYSRLRLRLRSGLYPSGFFTKLLYAFLFPHSCYMPCKSYPH